MFREELEQEDKNDFSVGKGRGGWRIVDVRWGSLIC